jgi:PAS domain S-box-containing protein
VADTPEPSAHAALSPYDDAAFLRMMLESVPAFVVLLDAELRVRYINRLQPGFKLQDVLGRPTFDFIEPRYHELHRAAIDEARRTGKVTSYTVRGDGGEGRVAYYESRLVPLSVPTAQAAICVIALEVTEHVARGEALRESEEKLRLAVSATGIGLWSWDLARDKVEWNERMHEIIGCDQVTSPADYMKKLVHPDDRPLLEREIRLMRAGVPEYPAHRIVRPRDGSVRWVMAFGGSRRNESEPAEHLTGAMIDITGQRQLEEHLRAVQKMDAIGALTAGVAHNFNNMLAVIIPAVELALRTVKGNEQRLLAEAAHAAHRAADLVAQLMTFAGQRKPADRGAIHVSDVIERAVSMCQRAFDRQIEIAVTFEGVLPRVHGDAAGLEQVLVNALINARDAIVSAQPANPRIVVRCSTVHTSLPPHAPREHVRIAIEDIGIGMSDAVIGRLFEPFFTTKEPGKGTGLGLATSYAIVREHGGFISYESEERVGTTCEVFLPCSGSEPAPPPSVPQLDGLRRRGRILVIDDEPAVRSVVSEALALDGHETLLAANGQEALARLEQEPAPDLILFDRSMPGWGPMRTLAEIRKRVPAVPVLFFTGENVPADERARVQGVLQKPLALGELSETVQRWLRK